jgi:hypothetical protein
VAAIAKMPSLKASRRDLLMLLDVGTIESLPESEDRSAG